MCVILGRRTNLETRSIHFVEWGEGVASKALFIYKTQFLKPHLKMGFVEKYGLKTITYNDFRIQNIWSQ